ncbi:MAG: peptide chain release factor N(5)-glutamine methyltransferase [Deltaproteobacteria bacterium]
MSFLNLNLSLNLYFYIMIAIAEKNLTIKEVLSWAEGYLNGYGVADPKAETEYLLSHLLNCKRSGLYLNHDKSLAIDEFQRFMDWLNRRIAREPSQYIIGEQEFWGLEFKVTRDVLIPRPETEILVEEAVKTVRSQESEVRSQNTKIHYSELRTPNSKLILDLCTGSGCIAISLAKEIPNSKVFAVDISEKALDVARENAERHGVAGRMTFLQGDLFEIPHPSLSPLKGETTEVRGCLLEKLKFDLIVSNPPYISKKMMKELQPEIKDYEPVTALYGGEDGLDFYSRIISESPAYLAERGNLILEMGYGQAEEIKKLIEQDKAFEHIDIKKDFAGIDRVIKAQRKG